MVLYNNHNTLVPLTESNVNARSIDFDDTLGLHATDVQEAIDNLTQKLQANYQSSVDDVREAIPQEYQPQGHTPQDVAMAIRQIPNTMPEHTGGTFDAGTIRSNSLYLDMPNHHYRYVDTSHIANYSTETYTYPQNSTGGVVQLGENNKVRYVNATNVYNKGVVDGKQKLISSIDRKCLYVWGSSSRIEKSDVYTMPREGIFFISMGSGNNAAGKPKCTYSIQKPGESEVITTLEKKVIPAVKVDKILSQGDKIYVTIDARGCTGKFYIQATIISWYH